ncbi:uncharacterized protein METZ01_LOCUS377603, partial [marine metagenome]
IGFVFRKDFFVGHFAFWVCYYGFELSHISPCVKFA